MDAPTSNAVITIYMARLASTAAIWAGLSYILSHADFLTRLSTSEYLVFSGMATTSAISMYVVWKTQFPPKGSRPISN